MKNRIQIAGIVDQQEASMLVELGVTYLGFPFRLPVHKEDLTETEAARIIRSLPSNCNAVVITYLNQASEVIELCNELGTRNVQLHGPIETGELIALKRKNFVLIKSLIVREDNLAELTEEMQRVSEFVDGFITDTFDPATGATGATGKTHDWSTSKRLVDLSPKPVMLAGGLTPENVADAIREVRPAGVDAHSGVEGGDGRKDPTLVSKFIREALNAF